jgi:uncharacterized repeat protein (TIGR01451 family)
MKRSLSTLFIILLLYSSESARAQNDIQVLGDAVLTPGEIAEGATVLYLIRFQNMGEDTAHQIVVYDTLDPRFDPASYNLVSASHASIFLRDGNNNLRWYFENINLPGRETDPGNSIGFIMFSIRPLPFIESGQVITNNACILFDEFQHICTNEAPVWIDEDAESEEPGASEVREYLVVPNPNYGEFVVQPKSGEPAAAEWWITDVSGKIIWDGSSEDMASVNHQVMLERPAPGLYLLWIESQGRLQVEQFAVMR